MRRILNLFSIYSWVCNELAQVGGGKDRESFQAWRHSWQNRSNIIRAHGRDGAWSGDGVRCRVSKMHRCICLICLVIAHSTDTHTHTHTHAQSEYSFAFRNVCSIKVFHIFQMILYEKNDKADQWRKKYRVGYFRRQNLLIIDWKIIFIYF